MFPGRCGRRNGLNRCSVVNVPCFPVLPVPVLPVLLLAVLLVPVLRRCWAAGGGLGGGFVGSDSGWWTRVFVVVGGVGDKPSAY